MFMPLPLQRACLLPRYYFYGQQQPTPGATQPPPLFLVEAIVRTDSLSIAVTLKTEAPQLLPQFLEMWQLGIMGFSR